MNRNALAQSAFLILATFTLAGCGGGSRPAPTPAPPVAPAPTPTPTPTPTPSPPPTGNFDTAETRRSDGVNYHGAITAYQAGATGQGILAGVIDDGVDTDSPEFAGRISSLSADVAGSRGIDGEGSHGTNVAQQLLGGKNDAGTFGIAFKATLLVLRADRPGSCATEDPSNDESGCRFTESAIAAGLDRAVVAGARVVNISLGGADPPGATLRAAIARATAAGIIIVASAGNNGDTTANGNDPNNPELFARGLRDAGGSSVIIVGSVNKNGVVSDFSNRAGIYSGSYLAALGEGLCCAYENGVIKTQSGSGGNFIFLLNGTSFAAPQVAGAVALLAQAFPSMTGAQIVQLLYQSARDAGAAGPDAVYGRGILDIARAFQPMGATLLAGTATAVPLGSPLGMLGRPMGDAGVQSAGVTTTLVTDAFGRAFDVDLGGALAQRRPDFRLAGAIGGLTRQQIAASDDLAVSLITAPAVGAADPLAGLGYHEAQQARALAASAIMTFGDRTRAGLAVGRDTSGLLAGERGEASGAMLIADAAQQGIGLSAEPGLGMVMRRTIGDGQAISVTAEIGRISRDRPSGDLLHHAALYSDNRYHRLGAAWDSRFGALALSAGASWLRETDSLLGARLGPLFGAGGATSITGDVRLGLDLGDGWGAAAAWRQMWTAADRRGRVSGGTLWSNAFSVDLSHAGLLVNTDRAFLRFAQPLRVARGSIELQLPVAFDYQSGQADFGKQPYNLAPTGRERTVEASYMVALWGGHLTVNGWWRQDPGHIAAMSDETGAAFRFTRGF